MDTSDWESGDMILFHGTSWYSYVLEWFGHCRVSHVGILVRDVDLNRMNVRVIDMDPNGWYVLHSGYGISTETGLYQFGVHIESLSRVLSQYGWNAVWIRKMHVLRNNTFVETMKRIHESIHQRPYDMSIRDWIMAEWVVWFPMFASWFPSSWYQKTDHFWCSALVIYVYARLGWVHPNLPWSILSPFECTEKGTILRWNIPVGSQICIQ